MSTLLTLWSLFLSFGNIVLFSILLFVRFYMTLTRLFKRCGRASFEFGTFAGPNTGSEITLITRALRKYRVSELSRTSPFANSHYVAYFFLAMLSCSVPFSPS